ncbi:MAG: rhodanese-like domain-containing protein [Lachnospiraceae bacterium]|nr:rhodanese-like domain-containing protein [Lachnospiraceae bacterium]
MADRTLSVREFLEGNREETIYVDIREEEHVRFGTIAEAKHIPASRMQELYQLPKDKKIYVFCQKGEISAEIVEVLLDAGYDAYHLEGGYLAYLATI